jgi:tryptophan synthase beta chain
MTPLLPMYSIGHGFVPAPIHAGGLRYHGMAPLVSKVFADGLIEARAYNQIETFSAGSSLPGRKDSSRRRKRTMP